MPINTNALLMNLTNAMTALTEQIRKQNDFTNKQEQRAGQQPAILREEQDDVMARFARQTKPHIRLKSGLPPRRQDDDRLPSPEWDDDMWGDTRPDLQEDTRLPPPPPDGERRIPRPGPRLGRRSRTALGRQYKRNLRQYQSQVLGPPDDAQSGMPPNAADSSLDIPGTHQNVMPWLFMPEGTHGAPQFLRKAIMENYALQTSMNWANKGATQLGQAMANPNSLLGRMANTIPGINQGTIGGISAALQTAQQHPWATYGAYKTIGKISDGLSNMRDIGQILGYSSPGGTSGWMGFSNPLSKLPTNPAVQEGLAFEMGKLSLEGRNPFGNFGVTSVTSGQAKSIMDALANQGWQMNPQGTPAGQPSGNAMSIAQNFMAPLMRQFPGLSAQDLSQFTPQLRYSAASTSDLVQALGDLGAQAKATQQTIGQTTSSIQAYTEATRGMGGSSIAGAATATGFTEETGMNPQLLGQAIQSPFIKGYAMSQGIMPWALGEQGATTNAMLGQGVNFLMGASRGMSMQTRRVLDRQTGQMQQVSGSEQQLDWVAQQLGWTRQQLQGYLQSEKSGVARRRVMEEIGQEGGTGNTFYNEVKAAGGLSGSQMTAAQKAQANKDWAKMIPDLQRAGLTQKQIGQLGGEGYKKRIADLQNMLTNQASAINKVHDTSQGTTNVNVQIGLTGYAAKLFKVSSQTSPAKKVINAGGTYNGASTYGQVYNRPEGDVSSPGGMYPATNAPETATPGGMYPTTPGPTQSPGGMYPTYGGSSTSNPAYGAG